MNIRVGCLGGLGENGKNMSIVEVDNRIFVLDCGLKYPDIDMYGVDSVVQDISYLVLNQDKIEGIFLSHGHEDQIGAIPFILGKINVPVFGTHFTICLVEDLLKENGFEIANYKLYRINENKTLKFKTATVNFFNLSHGIPEAVGISINTIDGSICYVTDFTFTFNNEHQYRSSFDKISELGKNNCLLALVESIGVNSNQNIANDEILVKEFKKILLNKERIIVTAFSSTIQRIQSIIDVSLANGRTIGIVGRKSRRIIDIAINNNYLKIPQDKLLNLKYIDEEHDNYDPNSVILVLGVKDEPYRMVQRMVKKQDRLIHLVKGDIVVNMSPAIPGTEKFAQECLNDLYENDIDVVILSNDILKSTHANERDLLLLYSLLKPTYLMPIKGEYRHLYRQKEIAKAYGFLDDNIIMLENYQFVSFRNQMIDKVDTILAKDVFIDGSLTGINEEVIKERETIAEEGIIIIALAVDLNTKSIITKPSIIKKGYVCPHDNPLEESLLAYAEKQANEQLVKPLFNLQTLQNQIINYVSQAVYKKTKKRPIVLADVQVVEVKTPKKVKNQKKKINK